MKNFVAAAPNAHTQFGLLPSIRMVVTKTIAIIKNSTRREKIQRYTYRVLQTIQMKLILLWVWAEWAVLGRAKTPLKFKYEIQIG